MYSIFRYLKPGYLQSPAPVTQRSPSPRGALRDLGPSGYEGDAFPTISFFGLQHSEERLETNVNTSHEIFVQRWTATQLHLSQKAPTRHHGSDSTITSEATSKTELCSE